MKFHVWLDRWKWWLLGSVMSLYVIIPACEVWVANR